MSYLDTTILLINVGVWYFSMRQINKNLNVFELQYHAVVDKTIEKDPWLENLGASAIIMIPQLNVSIGERMRNMRGYLMATTVTFLAFTIVVFASLLNQVHPSHDIGTTPLIIIGILMFTQMVFHYMFLKFYRETSELCLNSLVKHVKRNRLMIHVFMVGLGLASLYFIFTEV